MNNNRKHHLKIVKPFRFFVFVLICITIIAFAGYLIFGQSKAIAAGEPQYAQVLVQEDDTLWNIIETYNPNADINMRTAIHEVYEINNMDGADINPGDILQIPVY